MTSILTVGQYYIERHYARGSNRILPPTPLQRCAGCNGRDPAHHAGRRPGSKEAPVTTCPSRRARTAGDLATPMVRGRGGAQVASAGRGAQGHRPGGPPGRGVRASSAPPARASRPSCAASTTWRRSTPGGSTSTASWSATARRATSCTSCATARSPPSARDIGMVFQRFNLFPHMTALENVIEAPVPGAGARPRPPPGSAARACWSGSGSPTRPTATPPSSPAASSSGSRSPGRWRWSPS